MATTFASIPIRNNGEEIDDSWFNTLRAAGADLESYIGSFIAETGFNIVNNQETPANITGLLFDALTQGAAFIDYEIYRNTTGGGATKRKEVGMLLVSYTPGGSPLWEITQPAFMGSAGVEFSITSGGQVQYTSDNQSGTADVSRMRFKARAMNIPTA